MEDGVMCWRFGGDRSDVNLFLGGGRNEQRYEATSKGSPTNAP